MKSESTFNSTQISSLVGDDNYDGHANYDNDQDYEYIWLTSLDAMRNKISFGLL